MRAAAARLVVLTALIAPTAIGMQQAVAADDPAALLLADAARQGRGGEELAQALAALGEAALPVAYEALAQGSVRLDDLDETRIQLERKQLQAVLTAITRLSPDAVRAFLGGLAQQATASERNAALRILAEMATTQDLDLCLQLAISDEGVERSARVQLEQTLVRVVARETKAVTALGTRFRAQPPGLYAAVIHAIGSAGSAPALRQLTELLESVPEADAVVLCEIARLGGLLPHPIDPRVRTRVRGYLDRNDPQLLAAAVYAVGRLGDHEAAEHLVVLLASDLEHVRARAHRVLRELSGKHLPPEQERWAAWYRTESEWWRRDAPFHKAELGSGAQFQVAAALRELAMHRLYRHELAPEVARCLDRPQEDIVRLACAVLGQLGSRTVLPELVELLEHRDAPIQEAAQRALERITGKHLDGPRAWRQLLN